MYTKWHACACPRSEESCWRFVISPETQCAVCRAGCGELRFGAPSDLFIMMKLVAAHEPLIMDYKTKMAVKRTGIF